MFLFRNFTLNSERVVQPALKIIYGVGWYKAISLSARVGVVHPIPFVVVNSYIFVLMTSLLRILIVSDVRIHRRISMAITRLVDTGSYRGNRHERGLPVHGQRTHSNANTQRSRRIRLAIK